MSWYLLPSGWPMYAADGEPLAARIIAQGGTFIAEDQVQAAQDAYHAGQPAPAGTDVVAALASLFTPDQKIAQGKLPDTTATDAELSGAVAALASRAYVDGGLVALAADLTADVPGIVDAHLGAPAEGLAQTVAGKLAAYYDDAGTFVDRGAIHTISRNLPTPVGVQPNIWSNVSGKGDNATFRGVAGGQFLARDRSDVDANSKGVLYALQGIVAPRVDRNNVPFDDVVGLSIENQGTAKGTDALYFGRNRGDKVTNPDADDWGNIIQSDARAPNFIRSIGAHNVGLSLSGATIGVTAIRLGNAQTISWMKGDLVTLQHAIRMTATNTLRLYEGGIDIRADLGVYLAARAVLANNQPLRSILAASGASNTETDVVRLTASDNLALYAGRATVLAGGGLLLAAVTAIPSAPAAGAVVIYSDAGVLKAKTSSGAITTIAS